MKIDIVKDSDSTYTGSLIREAHDLTAEIKEWAKNQDLIIINLQVNMHYEKLRIRGLFENDEEATMFLLRFG